MRKRALLRAITDVVIVVFVIIAACMMLSGIDKTFGGKGLLSLQYFTVESNLLIGLFCLIAFCFDLPVFLGKRETSPRVMKVLLLVGGVGTTLTMLVALCYLLPTMGAPMILGGANLFMHLLVPITVLVRVLLLEQKENSARFCDAFYGAVPMFVYGIFYLVNVVVHNGYGDFAYDWYQFGKGGLGPGIAIFIALLVLTEGFSLLLWWGQKKISAKLDQ